MEKLRLLLMITSIWLISGCQMRTLEPASDTASTLSGLISFSFWLMMIVLVTVFLLFFRFVYKYHETEETKDYIPHEGKEHKWWEVTWTVLPILLLIVLAVPAIKATYSLTYQAEAGEDGFKEDAMNIQVEAKRFSWTFTYENGKESYNELVLPVDQRAAFTITSKDVVHSFWIPKLAGKVDAIPGKKTHLVFEPNTKGTFQGKCAEFCGARHAYMRFDTRVVSEEEFEKWLKTKEE